VKVAGLSDVVEVVTGDDFSCARRKAGTVVCWGNNFDGQLGDGRGAKSRAVASLRPTGVSGLRTIVGLSTGEFHACALDKNGAVTCWGNGDDGQIGSDARRAFSTPQPITQLGPVRQIAAGWSHVCALETKGTVGCWGRNTEGQLGDGKSGSRLKAVTVAGLSDAVELVSGHDHSCARRRGGQVVCWGDNSGGQLGPGARGEPKRNTPVVVPDLGAVVELAAGGHHNCVRLDSGRVICWGSNDFGQLGTTRSQARTNPRVMVRGVTDAVDLALGDQHSCALRAAGEVACWGDTQHGALGPYPLR